MTDTGIGVDIVDISRMEQILRKTPSFARRVFTAEECAYCDSTNVPAAHYACRFAAREAVLKSLGVGFGNGFGRKDISVHRDDSGNPRVILSERALSKVHELGVVEIILSLSFTSSIAVANAMALTKASAPEQKEDEYFSQKTYLKQTFKKSRYLLDELDLLTQDQLEQMVGTKQQAAEAEGAALESVHVCNSEITGQNGQTTLSL